MYCIGLMNMSYQSNAIFTLISVATILLYGISSCDALQTSCHVYEAKFTGSYCDSTTFSFKRCVDPQIPTDIDQIQTDMIENGVATYTEANCKSNAAYLTDSIIKPGCVYMKGVIKPKSLITCDKTQYCSNAQTMASMTTTCTESADCPTHQSVVVPTTFYTCCNYIENLLKKHCTKQDPELRLAYLDQLIQNDKCRNINCIGAGSAARAAHVLSFLAISITFLLAASQ